MYLLIDTNGIFNGQCFVTPCPFSPIESELVLHVDGANILFPPFWGCLGDAYYYQWGVTNVFGDISGDEITW